MQPDQNQETRRVALYARASGQDEESIQTQLEAMQPHVEENGLEVVRGIRRPAGEPRSVRGGCWQRPRERTLRSGRSSFTTPAYSRTH